jgi:hypothetical protein
LSNPWRFPIALYERSSLCCPAILLRRPTASMYTLGFTLLYISFGTMLLLSIYKETDRPRPKPGFATRALAGMGVFSYTLYLWHVPWPAGVFVTSLLDSPTSTSTCCTRCTSPRPSPSDTPSGSCGTPILKLRERLFPAPALGVEFTDRPMRPKRMARRVVRETPGRQRVTIPRSKHIRNMTKTA